MHYADDHFLFPLVREPRSRWERPGLSPRQERAFNAAMALLVLLFVAGWAYTIALRLSSPRPADPDAIDTPILGGRGDEDPNAPPTIAERIGRGTLAPALTAELLRRQARSYASTLDPKVRGISGKVYTQILPPGAGLDLPASESGAEAELGKGLASRLGGGIFSVVLRAGRLAEPVPNLQVIRMVPMSVKVNGSVGRYRIGNWPCEVGRCPKNPIYATPPGLIEVTPQNKDIFLSEHIQLKDYITKLQENVWPKYVVINPKNLDKIELVVDELELMGHPVQNLFAVSGFRSPWYNANGGTTTGRGQLSRHMYGDAMDIAVDNDYNGIMDDLNGDGRIDINDARVIGAAVERVEKKYPQFIGGMHYYPPTGGHRGMVHIDSRGFRARW